MRSRLRLMALLAVVLTFTPSGSTRPAAAGAAYRPQSAECEFLAIINDYRADNGRTPLKLSTTLGAAAAYHSRDMVRNGYFSHTLSDGTTWSENIAAYGYPTQTSRAENLAAGQVGAQDTFTQWRNSAGHNRNMLDPRFNAIGVGLVSDPDSQYRHYWTTTFGSLADATVSCPDYREPAVEAGLPLTMAGGGRTTLSSPSTWLYDGKTSTTWATTWEKPARAAYAYVDLGSVKQVGEIEWMFTKGGCADRFSVQVSTDKQTWTTLTTRGTAYAGSWRSVANSAGQVRYVRFYFDNVNGDRQVGYLAEVRVYS